MRRSDAKKYVFDEEEGGYRYIGPRYQVMADEADYRRLKRWGLTAAILIFAAFVGCGTFVYGGMNCPYVLPFHILLMIPSAWMLSRFAKLWNKSDELTEAGNRLLMHVHWSSLACAALGLCAAVGQIVFSALHGLQAGDVAFIALMALCAPLGVAAFLLARKCPTELSVIDDMPDQAE